MLDRKAALAAADPSWQRINMTPDEQEALSLRHSSAVIRVLSLSSGRFAVFNRQDLCGIVERFEETREAWWPDEVPKKAGLDLEELGLI